MNFRRIISGLSAWLLVASSPVAWAAAPTPTHPGLARLHWLGLQHISADTNAAQFLKIWRLPETTALKQQTLDKLSRWLAGNAANTASAKLRPLLDDLVSSEFILQIEAPTSSSSQTPDAGTQLLLAVHLSTARAQLWQSNLAAALKDLTGQSPVSHKNGWTLTRSGLPPQIELSHQGKWTLIGVGPGIQAALTRFASRLATPATSSAGAWLTADFPPAQLGQMAASLDQWLGAKSRAHAHAPGPLTLLEPVTSALKQCHLTISGKAGNVYTHGTLDLVHPWDTALPAWQVPTNYIDATVNGFTAVRGLAPWLGKLPAWRESGFTPPDQMFFWGQSAIPFRAFVAFPLINATNQLSHLANRLESEANPWLKAHAQGIFQWHTNPPAFVWKGAMIISPWLKPIDVNHQNWLLGGLYSLSDSKSSGFPSVILHELNTTPGLIYYQVEDTGVRVDAGLFISQLFRVVFHKAQLPSGGYATQWIKKSERMLGSTTTEIRRSSSQQLDFVRKSSIGFSAAEIHLLADWLESPTFPFGLHTFTALTSH